MKNLLCLFLFAIMVGMSASARQTCRRCQGEGKIYEYCSYCKGYGEMYCRYCGGTGVRNCGFCSGGGILRCNRCNGRGVINDEYCSTCKGYGQVYCDNCGGTGKVECPERECDNGIVPCHKCNKTGIHSWSCPDCRGTGSTN